MYNASGYGSSQKKKKGGGRRGTVALELTWGGEGLLAKKEPSEIGEGKKKEERLKKERKK